MKAIEGEVFGRVQGVGFRYFTQALAVGLDIVGQVYNTPEGSVRFFAQGQEGVLNHFVKTLEQGPPGSKVERCVVKEGALDATINEFEITY